MRRPARLAALSVLLLTACGGGSSTGGGGREVTVGLADSALEGTFGSSWVGRTAGDPAVLGALLDSASADGWIALYHNNYEDAVDVFARNAGSDPGACVGLLRAHSGIAAAHRKAAAFAREMALDGYQYRFDYPDGMRQSALSPYFAGISALQAGDAERAASLFELTGEAGEFQPFLDAARALASGDTSAPLAAALAIAWQLPGAEPEGATEAISALPAAPRSYVGPLRTMLQIQGNQLRMPQQLGALSSRTPDLDELLGEDEVTGTRLTLKHYDLARLDAVALWHERRAGGEGLPAGCTPDADSALGREVFDPRSAGGTVELLASAAPVFSAPIAAQQVDELLRSGEQLELELSAWVTSHGVPEGKQLVDQLDLVELVLAEGLRARAQGYEDGALFPDAKRILEYTLDKSPRTSNPDGGGIVSFLNEPSFLVDLSRVNASIRQFGEASDYIHPLTELYPALWPLRHHLGIVSASAGIGREGGTRAQ